MKRLPGLTPVGKALFFVVVPGLILLTVLGPVGLAVAAWVIVVLLIVGMWAGSSPAARLEQGEGPGRRGRRS